MIKLITYTDSRMTFSAENLRQTALKFGCEEAKIYTPDDLSEGFKEIMQPALKIEKGAGLWCWKPYIILDAMRSMNEGDLLIYCDAGTSIVAPIGPVIAAMTQEVMMFNNGWRHLDWCKGDCWLAMLSYESNGWKELALENASQVQASQIFFYINPNSVEFVEQWMMWCQVTGMIDDEPSVKRNVDTFREHRHDQAILTNLQIIHDYKLHWWPNVYAEHLRHLNPEDKYTPIFNHHRKRNSEW